MTKYRIRKNGFSVDLSQIENYTSKLLRLGSEAKNIATDVATDWGAKTEMVYRSKITYGNGFHRTKYKGLTAFNATQATKEGFKTEVGHEHFVARFLEVGTKAHTINTKRGGKTQEIRVKGIKGSGALKKSIEEQLPTLVNDIGEALKDKIDK